MFQFATILFIQILSGMEMDLFIPSFPQLQTVFELSPAMVQLTVTINLVAFCICSLFAGTLGDKFNRRHIVLLGLGLFVLGSTLCVFASHFSMLLMGRLLQGIGICAPAILSFPILLDSLPSEKQPGTMGIVNGVKTLAMAIAPLIGSFINLYFNWRGNFSILLLLGIICFIASFYAIPHKKGDLFVSLSIKSFYPLFKSRKFITLLLSLSLLVAAYWLFMAMAPILYMDDMNVSLTHFGFYQGSLSLTFALICILSPSIFKAMGVKNSFYMSIALCVLSTLLVLALIVAKAHQPLVITFVLILFSIGIVLPINILYPLILNAVAKTQGRAAGLGQATVLFLTAFFIQIVAYFYNGMFLAIGIGMLIASLFAFLFIAILIKNKWIEF